MSDTFGYTIFADDIRQEVGGKLSVMGIYSGTMLFSFPFPIIIPKLSMLIHFIEPMDKPIAKSFSMLVYTPDGGDDNPAVKVDLSPGEPINRDDIIPAAEDARRIVVHRFDIPNFIVTKSGRVKVRVDKDGEITKCGSLLIRRATPEEVAHLGLAPSPDMIEPPPG